MSPSLATDTGLPLFRVSSSATVKWIELLKLMFDNPARPTFLLVAFNQICKLIQESRSLGASAIFAPSSFESCASSLHGDVDVLLRC